MKTLFLALCPLLLLACHPKEGDYYEKLSSGERLKIVSTGTAQELALIAKTMATNINSITQKTRGINLVRVRNLSSAENDKCVLLENPESAKLSFAAGQLEYLDIVPTSSLDNDYRRIN